MYPRPIAGVAVDRHGLAELLGAFGFASIGAGVASCDAAVLVRQHLPGFLARFEEAGHALPGFVKAELEGFATCGDFEKAFEELRETWESEVR